MKTGSDIPTEILLLLDVALPWILLALSVAWLVVIVLAVIVLWRARW